MGDLPSTCLAAVMTKPNAPIDVREVRVPDRLEPGAALVRIDVASICGSDVHQWEGESGVSLQHPVILGHEMMGTIVRLGDGLTHDSVGQPLREGERIIWSHAACGQCHFCRVIRQETLCPNRVIGMTASAEEFPYILGGFSQYCYVLPTAGKVRVPDDVKSEWASPAACALRSVLHGFERVGQIEPHETVVIQGAGPLGLYATAIASHIGARQIIVIGAPADRLEVAKKYGATATISIEEEPGARQRRSRVQELTQGLGADVVFEFSGAVSAVPEGIQLARRGGRYLVMGQLGSHEVSIRPALITLKHLSIIGTFSADIRHYWKALDFIRQTRHTFDFDAMISTRYPLGRINEAMHNMQAFKEIKPLVLPHA
ncbi:MAG TPA: zinc-binding dehydrogenase [Dehalococcoidia bacterium]|nr:zinc-binding dehydrogenase [Dehalococcoidia bacterium]